MLLEIQNYGQINKKNRIVSYRMEEQQLKYYKNITLKIPKIQIIEYDTLIFDDEMQECVCTTILLKAF